jgi:hypothetical protein
MLQNLDAFLGDTTVLQVVAAIGVSLASIAAAVYVHLYLTRTTRRKSDAYKEFNSKVGPWMAEARRRYAKGRDQPQVKPGSGVGP